jgi:hypothetical protein
MTKKKTRGASHSVTIYSHLQSALFKGSPIFRDDYFYTFTVNMYGSPYPITEPAPDGAEEAVGPVPEAIDEANIRRGQVEGPDNLIKSKRRKK